MKNFYVPLLAFFAFSTAVCAQEIDLASEIISSEEILKNEKKSIGKKDSVQQYEAQADETQAADDRGIFSFLNFSFIKKPFSNILSADDEEETIEEKADTETKVKETPLQRRIRRAEEGNVDAQLALGYMYLYGENGVESDFEQAFKFYKMAALQDNPIALNNLGSLYFNGIGTKRDYLQAAKTFERAAQLGSDESAVNLAFIYLSSSNNQSYLPEVVKLLTQASDNGNKTAQFMLGYIYYKGFQVQQDFHKANDLIRQASDALYDEAQYVLALMYLNGQGCAQNYGNGVHYLKLSASQGNLEAMMLLGDIFTEGTMYPRNLKSAHVFYNIASIDNVANAAQKRDSVRQKLKIEELLDAQSQAEAFKPKASELTTYIRQTFGKNIRRYIDDNMT